MPEKTFFNLPPAKRESFIHAALKEFASCDYRSASVSRIVEALGIAKGSVYQYFQDKKDLYFYLLDMAAERKLAYITEGLGEAGSDRFFNRFQKIILVGTKFDFSYPLYSLLLINAAREPYHPDLGNLARDLKDKSAEYLRGFTEAALAQGEIRRDLDLGLIVHMLNQAALSIGEYMEKKYSCALETLLRHPKKKPPFSQEQLETEIGQLLEILKKGILYPGG